MGGSNWNDDHYSARVATRARTGEAAFKHDAAIRSGRAEMKVHPEMDPSGVTRESRDSEAHPESVAIGVIFDVTGSMHTVPVQLQKKLPSLMGTLINLGYCDHPQVLFGAVGDHRSDRVPIQIGQFESGIEMDADLEKLVLEGMGGGSYEESYELPLYFFARHTSIDCYEKREKKGYLFIIGDEMPYKTVSRETAKKHFGDDLQAEVTIEDLIKEAQRKYHVYFIIPGGTMHYDDPKLLECWQKLLGQNVLRLPDPNAVCELIGSTVGLMEETVSRETVTENLSKGDAALARDVTSALENVVPEAAGENVRL